MNRLTSLCRLARSIASVWSWRPPRGVCATGRALERELERVAGELAAERARFDWVEANFHDIHEWDGDDGPPSAPHWCIDDPSGDGGWMNPTLRGLADRAREGATTDDRTHGGGAGS